MLHADLQFAILALRDCIPGVISPLLQFNYRGPHAAPSPFPLSLYSLPALLPPTSPSPAPATSPDGDLGMAEAGALPRRRPRIPPRGFWRRPHLLSSPARLDLHPRGGGAGAGDGRGGGGRAGRRRRRWWPDPAQAISQHLQGGRLLPQRRTAASASVPSPATTASACWESETRAATDVDEPPKKRRSGTAGLPGAATVVGLEAVEEDGARLELRCLLARSTPTTEERESGDGGPAPCSASFFPSARRWREPTTAADAGRDGHRPLEAALFAAWSFSPSFLRRDVCSTKMQIHCW
jgi:hypothetical protein